MCVCVCVYVCVRVYCCHRSLFLTISAPGQIQCSSSVSHIYLLRSGLSAGQVSMTFLGNDEFCHYILLGRAVDAVNKAEHFCNSGDIVASPSIWCHCFEFDIKHEVLDDDKHVKVSP